MKILKILYLLIYRKPVDTQYFVHSSNLIIRKKDKNYENFEYSYCLKQIEKYGNILYPVIVTKENFTSKYVVRINSAGYYALLNNHIHNIPIAFQNK